MTKEVENEKWNSIEQSIIYNEKALNSGIFSNGRYYDFYKKKEALSAEKFVHDKMDEFIEKTTVIDIENDFRTLYRLTIVFKKKE